MRRVGAGEFSLQRERERRVARSLLEKGEGRESILNFFRVFNLFEIKSMRNDLMTSSTSSMAGDREITATFEILKRIIAIS